MTPPEPRVVRAENPGPFTLDGTRTHLVGRDRVAVVDPGPDDPRHVRAVAEAVEGATSVVVLVSHGHPDHAAAATALGRDLGAPVLGFGPGASALRPGEEVLTDHGALVPVETPGHAREHLAFHWPRRGALFPGDLILGQGDTTWVGAYPGCVADYLESLETVRRLEPGIMYPAHGPPILDVPEALDRYRDHRLVRIRQVQALVAENPETSLEQLVRRVYGDEVPSSLVPAAEKSVEAILHHLRGDRG